MAYRISYDHIINNKKTIKIKKNNKGFFFLLRLGLVSVDIYSEKVDK